MFSANLIPILYIYRYLIMMLMLLLGKLGKYIVSMLLLLAFSVGFTQFTYIPDATFRTMRELNIRSSYLRSSRRFVRVLNSSLEHCYEVSSILIMAYTHVAVLTSSIHSPSFFSSLSFFAHECTSLTREDSFPFEFIFWGGLQRTSIKRTT